MTILVLFLLALLVAVAAIAWFIRTKWRSPISQAKNTLRSSKKVSVPRSKRTEIKIRADEELYLANLRQSGQATFLRDKQNAISIGSRNYIWRTCKDGDVCPTCKKKHGKRFSWETAPSGGHPGFCETCTVGHCRCYAEAEL